MSKSAIAATYVDFKNVKTRQVLQLVFEVPAHEAEEALKMLGIPNAAQERWFAIAPLKLEQKDSTPSVSQPQPVSDKPQAGAKREKQDWRDLPPAQQAALRCNSPLFTAFLREEHEDDWNAAGEDAAESVRIICGVSSRSLLNTEQRARAIWKQLDDQFQAWERVGA